MKIIKILTIKMQNLNADSGIELMVKTVVKKMTEATIKTLLKCMEENMNQEPSRHLAILTKNKEKNFLMRMNRTQRRKFLKKLLN